MRPLTLLTAALAVAPLWPATTWAQQGMAFTAPHAPLATEERETVSAKPRSDPTAREAPILPSRRLPNQATGSRKDRVIRDICIGC